MREHRNRLRFVSEAAQEIAVVRKLLLQNLDRDPAVFDAVVGAVDIGHAALAEQLVDLIAAVQSFSDVFIHIDHLELLGGLVAIRKMHINVMEQTELMPADEMLYPENYWYLADVLSYVAVGARSVEDQQHRLTVSGMDVPAGMKNPTSGDLSVMLNSVVAAQAKQTFIYRGWEVNTPGNELAHTILRGAVNKHGQCIPNYHYEDLMRLSNMYKTKDLKNPAVVVDANHSNSSKMYFEQIRIVKEVLHSCKHSADVKQLVKGVMIESYIEPGNQKVGEGVYGKSITDACLGWEESERLLYDIADLV